MGRKDIANKICCKTLTGIVSTANCFDNLSENKIRVSSGWCGQHYSVGGGGGIDDDGEIFANPQCLMLV